MDATMPPTEKKNEKKATSFEGNTGKGDNQGKYRRY